MNQFDSIPFDRMSPDSSAYTKGLRLVTNLVPYDGGSWREVGIRELITSDGHPFGTSYKIAGSWSDPSGNVFAATSEKVVSLGAGSRLYYYDPQSETLNNVTPGDEFVGAPKRWRFAKFGESVIAAPDNLPTAPVLELKVRSGSGDFLDLVTSTDRPAPRFIGVSRSYLVWGHNLSVGGAGVYASANPYQYGWSARNDAAVHTPGVDRSNFAFLNNDLGEITGLAGFREFWVLFQEFGVMRLTWIGGDAVWEAQQIAGHAHGLREEWSGSIVQSGRDIHYFSNSGPAVVTGGEAVENIESGVRRLLMDRADVEALFMDRSFYVDSVLDPLTQIAVWTTKSDSSSPDHYQLTRSLVDGRFSILDAESTSEGVGVAYQGNPNYPLGNLVFFQMNGLELEVRRLQSLGRETSPATLLTNRWRPETGLRCSIQGLRPLLLLDLNGGTYPLITITIQAATEPRFGAATDSVVVDTSDLDDNGWIRSSSFPLEGNEFIFTVTIPDLGPEPVIRELPALEIAFSTTSVF